MKQTKQILSVLAVAAIAVLAIGGANGAAKEPKEAAKSAWITDMARAKKLAAKEGKSILIDFTGSDWCGWCIKLKKEVFSHDEFVKGASKDFVLVELDFPKKSSQSDKEKAANKALAEKYQVQGFPTIVLTDAAGKKFAQTGYREGGPKPYLKHLKQLQDRKDLE